MKPLLTLFIIFVSGLLLENLFYNVYYLGKGEYPSGDKYKIRANIIWFTLFIIFCIIAVVFEVT